MAEYVLVGAVCGFMGFVFGWVGCIVTDEMGRGGFFEDAP